MLQLNQQGLLRLDIHLRPLHMPQPPGATFPTADSRDDAVSPTYSSRKGPRGILIHWFYRRWVVSSHARDILQDVKHCGNLSQKPVLCQNTHHLTAPLPSNRPHLDYLPLTCHRKASFTELLTQGALFLSATTIVFILILTLATLTLPHNVRRTLFFFGAWMG